MLSKKEIKSLEESLLERKKELKKLMRQSDKMPHFSDDGNLEDEANESEEMGGVMERQQKIKNHLQRIEGALCKIKKNSYGKCGRCGKEIGIRLLKVNPESELCRSCKISG